MVDRAGVDAVSTRDGIVCEARRFAQRSICQSFQHLEPPRQGICGANGRLSAPLVGGFSVRLTAKTHTAWATAGGRTPKTPDVSVSGVRGTEKTPCPRPNGVGPTRNSLGHGLFGQRRTARRPRAHAAPPRRAARAKDVRRDVKARTHDGGRTSARSSTDHGGFGDLHHRARSSASAYPRRLRARVCVRPRAPGDVRIFAHVFDHRPHLPRSTTLQPCDRLASPFSCSRAAHRPTYDDRVRTRGKALPPQKAGTYSCHSYPDHPDRRAVRRRSTSPSSPSSRAAACTYTEQRYTQSKTTEHHAASEATKVSSTKALG